MPRGRARWARGCATLSRRTEDAGGRSALRAVVQGDVACRLADRRGDRAGACQPRRRPSVDASPVVAIAAGTGGDRVHHLLSARADARFGRHDGAQACLRKLFGIGMVLLGGVAVGIGVARARVRRCRRGRDDVAVTTVRAAARLTLVTNPAAQRSRPSRCGQRSAISDRPSQPCPRAACIRPSTSPTNCRARRSEPSAHRRAARRSRPRTIRSSRSARRAPGRRAMRGS